ncbi:hypothetical protein D3C75_931550 [compost metagenome]
MAISIFLMAEVTIRLAFSLSVSLSSIAWSESTPIAYLVFSFAASKMPSPVPPATLKITSTPELYWISDNSLPLAGFTKSPAYDTATFTSGSTYCAP